MYQHIKEKGEAMNRHIILLPGERERRTGIGNQSPSQARHIPSGPMHFLLVIIDPFTLHDSILPTEQLIGGHSNREN